MNENKAIKNLEIMRQWIASRQDKMANFEAMEKTLDYAITEMTQLSQVRSVINMDDMPGVPKNEFKKLAVILNDIRIATGYNLAQLKLRSRIHNIKEARLLAMYRAREETNLSLEELGSIFNRTPPAVVYAHKKITALKQKK